MEPTAERIKEIIDNKGLHYKYYKIPKKNGKFREIDNPSKELKEMQRHILDNILNHISLHECAHGGTEGRSAYTNARLHVGAECVVCLDIKDFFPSISTKKVASELKRYVRTPYAIAELITYKDRIPQGAPTSPCMANIVCIRLDRKLNALARKHDAIYTRYFDDLTFSTKTNKQLPKIIGMAHSYVKKEGFDLNYEKNRIMRRGSKMVVTSLTVNEKLNVPRKRVRNFRAEVHQSITQGTVGEYDAELPRLVGFNSFIMGANKKKGKQLLKKIFSIPQNKIREKVIPKSDDINKAAIIIDALLKRIKTVEERLDKQDDKQTVKENRPAIFESELGI